MKEEKESRMPEIGEYVRGQGTLVEIQDIIPPPPPINKDYIFEEITASVELRLGDEVLNKIYNLWDAYGKGNSVKNAIEKGQEYASKKKIDTKSDLEVVVIKIVEQIRKRPNKFQKNFYDETFYLFDSLETGSKWNLPDPVRTVVWSSRWKDGKPE